nr:hypothetical protein [Petrachloros mirabilis]
MIELRQQFKLLNDGKGDKWAAVGDDGGISHREVRLRLGRHLG